MRTRQLCLAIEMGDCWVLWVSWRIHVGNELKPWEQVSLCPTMASSLHSWEEQLALVSKMIQFQIWLSFKELSPPTSSPCLLSEGHHTSLYTSPSTTCLHNLSLPLCVLTVALRHRQCMPVSFHISVLLSSWHSQHEAHLISHVPHSFISIFSV